MSEMSDLVAKRFRVREALNRRYTCRCGQVHETNLQDYILEEGAIGKLPGLLKKYNAKRIFLVADIHTMRAAGQAILSLLEEAASFDIGTHIYEDLELVPDDHAVEVLRLAGEAFGEADLWLAVGSGTLNDLTRYISHERGVPYIVFATAPSMDGYASGVSPLILNQMKQTFNAQSPLAIVADPEILADAPQEMLLAGAGDVFGKYSSLLDWSIARIAFDEYYCPEIVSIVERSRDAVAASVSSIAKREPEAIRLLFDALVEVGIAMDYCGNSRPASGAEHHLAHFWEMQFLFADKTPVLHGLKVGAALPIVLSIYEQLADMPETIDFDRARDRAKRFDHEVWVEGTKEAYGPASSGILKLEAEEGLQDPPKRLARIDRLEEQWAELIELAKTAPSVSSILELYEVLGFPSDVAKLGVDDNALRSALHHAKDLRARYTVMRLFEDLSIDLDILRRG